METWINEGEKVTKQRYTTGVSEHRSNIKSRIESWIDAGYEDHEMQEKLISQGYHPTFALQMIDKSKEKLNKKSD
jgi:hypothetical protein